MRKILSIGVLLFYSVLYCSAQNNAIFNHGIAAGYSEDCSTQNIPIGSSCTAGAVINGTSAICDGKTDTLSVSKGNVFLWSTGETTNSIIVQPSSTTTYYVTVRDSVCDNSDTSVVSETVNVNPLPNADAGEDIMVCDGGDIQLEATGGDKYSWQPAAGMTYPNRSNPQVFPTQTTTFFVTVTDTATGCVAKDSVIVYVNHGCKGDDSFVPNAFSPDPSGPNGGQVDPNATNNFVFHPTINGTTSYHFRVFNRWGKLIFESTNINIGWDGYYKGVLCKQNVYIWKLDASFSDGRTIEKVGQVLLLR